MFGSYQPNSAVAVTEEVYEAFVRQSEKIGVFAHGYTNSAHPVCAAVALETLNIYRDWNILGHVRDIAPKFQGALRRFADHPLVGEVRGVGLMAGIELVNNKARRKNDSIADGSHDEAAVKRPPHQL
jgi:4-aminobutyrate--pyruvate transaminase